MLVCCVLNLREVYFVVGFEWLFMIVMRVVDMLC